jgi:hypothetical protein
MCELTRTLRTLLTAALATAGVAWGGGGAAAAIIQLADVFQLPGVSGLPVPIPPGFALQEAHASIDDHGTGVINADILAQIPKVGVDPTTVTALASAAVGKLGSVGVFAQTFGNNTTTTTEVQITSDEFFNPFSANAHPISKVLIDGGSMRFSAAGPNSTILFLYFLTVKKGPNIGTSNADIIFTAAASLTSDSAGVVSFTKNKTGFFGNTFGLDLGITFDPNTDSATIPPSLQTLDLGLLGPHEGMELDYDMEFELVHGVGGSENLIAQFSDPFHLSANPAFGTISFGDTVASVPEPSTWAMMLLGFVGLGFAFRQSRRKVSMA